LINANKPYTQYVNLYRNLVLGGDLMSLFGFSIILCIVLFVVLGLTRSENTYRFRIRRRQLLAILPLLLCLFNFFTIIPANTVGVQYSPFSGIKEETLSEGIHTKGFFDTIYKISTEVQTKTIENVIGQTRDAQYITITADIKFKVDPVNAFNVFRQFRTLDNVDKSLITPAVQRSVEAVTTQFDVIEILGSRRNDVYIGIEADLRERLGLNGINLHSITLTDTDAGDAIEKAIQDEAVAKKAVETAEQEREKAKIESEKRVIEAQADKQKAQVEAETQLIKAKADAEAKVIEAEGNAKAYEVLSEHLSDEVIRKIWIDKWDGKLPSVVSGENGLIFDVGGGN